MVSSGFEAAVDAIVRGDTHELRRLLSEEPELTGARSQRKHGATLLHYVSANGVEDERQKTPKNIVEITEILLHAGADIEATADMYGGACATLGLAATSTHPQRAGVMEPLLSTLLAYGARIDPLLVNACLANGRGEAAEFLASRGAPVNFPAAAGLGHVEVVKASFQSANREQLEQGFLYACQFGRNDVVEFLLGAGVGIDVRDRNGQTGLHWAVVGRRLDTVKLLLAHNPPLDAKNVYGGTVLGQALWSAEHDGNGESYSAIIEALVVGPND